MSQQANSQLTECVGIQLKAYDILLKNSCNSKLYFYLLSCRDPGGVKKKTSLFSLYFEDRLVSLMFFLKEITVVKRGKKRQKGDICFGKFYFSQKVHSICGQQALEIINMPYVKLLDFLILLFQIIFLPNSMNQ